MNKTCVWEPLVTQLIEYEGGNYLYFIQLNKIHCRASAAIKDQNFTYKIVSFVNTKAVNGSGRVNLRSREERRSKNLCFKSL